MHTDGQTRDNLWTLITPPTLWALHFLVSYVLAAYECTPNDRIFETIGGARVAIAGVTLVALILIAAVFRRAWRDWRGGGGSRFYNDEDTEAARERFLEFSTVLLAALSFVAVLFVALPVLINADCR
ncbi:hypothetical protein [Aurantimonas marianensis]|uniref:Transmembrane protein n=1 Tax=Aurantimonas marianensis TaxID=2920428 RepID=A0A9X2KGV7_9HYPH|nr:hypothetical protein [Aurantimonas marianensis]MCP3054072.1 hypothetical protein [Aurantimonas marianensis]